MFESISTLHDISSTDSTSSKFDSICYKPEEIRKCCSNHDENINKLNDEYGKGDKHNKSESKSTLIIATVSNENTCTLLYYKISDEGIKTNNPLLSHQSMAGDGRGYAHEHVSLKDTQKISFQRRQIIETIMLVMMPLNSPVSVNDDEKKDTDPDNSMSMYHHIPVLIVVTRDGRLYRTDSLDIHVKTETETEAKMKTKKSGDDDNNGIITLFECKSRPTNQNTPVEHHAYDGIFWGMNLVSAGIKSVDASGSTRTTSSAPKTMFFVAAGSCTLNPPMVVSFLPSPSLIPGDASSSTPSTFVETVQIKGLEDSRSAITCVKVINTSLMNHKDVEALWNMWQKSRSCKSKHHQIQSMWNDMHVSLVLVGLNDGSVYMASVTCCETKVKVSHAAKIYQFQHPSQPIISMCMVPSSAEPEEEQDADVSDDNDLNMRKKDARMFLVGALGSVATLVHSTMASPKFQTIVPMAVEPLGIYSKLGRVVHVEPFWGNASCHGFDTTTRHEIEGKSLEEHFNTTTMARTSYAMIATVNDGSSVMLHIQQDDCNSVNSEMTRNHLLMGYFSKLSLRRDMVRLCHTDPPYLQTIRFRRNWLLLVGITFQGSMILFVAPKKLTSQATILGRKMSSSSPSILAAVHATNLRHDASNQRKIGRQSCDDNPGGSTSTSPLISAWRKTVSQLKTPSTTANTISSETTSMRQTANVVSLFRASSKLNQEERECDTSIMPTTEYQQDAFDSKTIQVTITVDPCSDQNGVMSQSQTCHIFQPESASLAADRPSWNELAILGTRTVQVRSKRPEICLIYGGTSDSYSVINSVNQTITKTNCKRKFSCSVPCWNCYRKGSFESTTITFDKPIDPNGDYSSRKYSTMTSRKRPRFGIEMGCIVSKKKECLGIILQRMPNYHVPFPEMRNLKTHNIRNDCGGSTYINDDMWRKSVIQNMGLANDSHVVACTKDVSVSGNMKRYISSNDVELRAAYLTESVVLVMSSRGEFNVDEKQTDNELPERLFEYKLLSLGIERNKVESVLIYLQSCLKEELLASSHKNHEDCFLPNHVAILGEMQKITSEPNVRKAIRFLKKVSDRMADIRGARYGPDDAFELYGKIRSLPMPW